MKSKSWIIKAVICVNLMQIIGLLSKEDDKIAKLPGQPQVSFKQYGGYTTIDDKQKRALFYYFVEAQTDPCSKPLVLWLNGGPGCSSVGAGAFSEHGPFRPSGGGNLLINQYAWNKEANMLYLDSPAGVGFSYSHNTSFYDSVDDTITAQDNLKFLQKWLLKFPVYKNRDLFLTGESYAGHYVPQLAKLILESGLRINLKGIAIGNPLLDFSTDINSEGEYYWSHGLISDSTYQVMGSVCNISQLVREHLIRGNVSVGCKALSAQLSKEIPNSIDNYDVTADICVSSVQSLHIHPFRPGFQFTLSTQLLQQQVIKHPKAEENIDICVQEKTLEYLNRKDVQEALHAQLIGVNNWTFCSQVLKYEMENLELSMIDVVGSLISSGIPVLVYSGDQDSVVPFTGTRNLINGLGKKLRLNITAAYRPWFVDKQVGGWTQVFGGILTFTTIRGGSHMAPFSSPKRSLALFKAFLTGNSLS